MAPVTEEEVVQVEELQPEHPSTTGEEISRAAKQKRLENLAKSCKQKLTSDVNTVTKMLNEYHTDYPEDNLSNKLQLGEATDIIKVFDRVGDRWNTVETTLDDLKTCIFSSLTLPDIDDRIERVEAAKVEYADKFRKLKRINERL